MMHQQVAQMGLALASSQAVVDGGILQIRPTEVQLLGALLAATTCRSRVTKTVIAAEHAALVQCLQMMLPRIHMRHTIMLLVHCFLLNVLLASRRCVPSVVLASATRGNAGMQGVENIWHPAVHSSTFCICVCLQLRSQVSLHVLGQSLDGRDITMLQARDGSGMKQLCVQLLQPAKLRIWPRCSMLHYTSIAGI